MRIRIFKKRKRKKIEKRKGLRVLSFKKYKSAFTLSELLISLSVIGVISALSMPVLMQTNNSKVNEAGLRKAMAVLDETVELSRFAPGFSPAPKCFYWASGKRPSWMCNGQGTKTNVNPNTGEKSWTCADGSGLPSNWNGEFSQCAALLDWLRDNMRTVKKCKTSGYSEGCMPKYKGNDQVYKDNNSNVSDKDSVTATSGCNGWRSSKMLNKYSWVTADGMIFFPYDRNWPGAAIIGVDVNGKKGPNKWGHDVFVLQLMGDDRSAGTYYPGGCEFVEKGGKSGTKLLKEG